MDENTLLFLLRGGHLSMSDRIEKGLWPHPPLKYSDVVECVTKAVELETWFPLEWKPIEGKSIREGGIIERLSSSKYIYRSYRHQAINPTILAEQSEIVFKSSQAVVRYYLKWDLHLPGDLDGWQVTD
jgi:hypothetical protein